MDGREFVATKTYTPDNGVQMVVTFKCLADTQRLHVTINSMVGDPNNPSQRSAFQKYEDTTEEAMFDSRVPIMKLAGRIRFGSLQPQALSGMFSVDDHFANEIVADLSSGSKPPLSSNQAAASLLSAMSNIMTGSAPTVDSIYTAYAQLVGNSSSAPNSTPSGFNPIAGLHELFPIGVELVNGAGTYDLSIPYVDQIRSVMDQCGGAEPALRGEHGTSTVADPQYAPTPPPTSGSTNVNAEDVANSAATTGPVSASTEVVADTTPSPSFDCSRASTNVEHLICANGQLARLDVQLSQAYKLAISTSSDKGAVQAAQRSWQKDVRNVCTDIPCIESAYKSRLAELSQSDGQ